MLLTIPLTTLLLASSVIADPILEKGSPVTVPIFRRTNFTSVNNLLHHDQSRVKFLKAPDEAKAAARTHNASLSKRDGISMDVSNQAVIYVASVGFGCPPKNYELIIDTGSSNTWIGANNGYVQTACSAVSKDLMAVPYGSAFVSGIEYNDTVTLAPRLVIQKQSIGVALVSEGIKPLDGILGIGPAGLTQGTLLPDINAIIPTVTDNLYKTEVISQNQIGVFFSPTAPQNDPNGMTTFGNGTITFGGVDLTKVVGLITYAPVTNTPPASLYWGIDASFHYGNSTDILGTTAGIVDTGTTLLLLATDAFNKYKTATGATADPDIGLLSISDFNTLQTLYFVFGDRTFELSPDAQIWPRALNSAIGGNASNIYLIVGDLGTNSGGGLDFILGYAALERIYSVFDTTNKRVGLATHSFTNATSNYQE